MNFFIIPSGEKLLINAKVFDLNFIESKKGTSQK